MGRKPHKSKKAVLFGSLFKLSFASFALFCIVYSVTFGVKWVSDYGFPSLLVKALPLSGVAGKYIDLSLEKVGFKDALTNLSPSLDAENQDTYTSENSENTSNSTVDLRGGSPNRTPLLKTCLLSDSHNDNAILKKALEMAKGISCEYVFYLGDYSAVGSVPELTAAKEVMDNSGLTYYSLPGDHDLWKSGGLSNYKSLFGDPDQKIILRGITFLFLDNSDNETGVSAKGLEWFSSELKLLDTGDQAYVFLSNPLYNSSNFKLMGENSTSIKEQAAYLLKLIRNSEVKAIFAGDNHLSSRSADLEKPTVEHVVVGALTEDRNLQSPRFDELTIFTDGTYSIREIEVVL